MLTGKESYLERQKWFKDRIGKRVFRNNTTCQCSVCQSVYEKGIVIDNEMHASYMHDMEGCSWEDDGQKGIKYFDTKEEVKGFEEKHFVFPNDLPKEPLKK